MTKKKSSLAKRPSKPPGFASRGVAMTRPQPSAPPPPMQGLPPQALQAMLGGGGQ